MAEERATIREQLIAGGVEHVRTKGTTDLSVRALAGAGNRSTMCVYSKFGSRDALVDAIYEQAAAELVEAVETDDQAAFARSLRDFAGKNPGIWELLMRAVPGVDRTRREELMRRLAGLLDQARAGGESTPAELVLATVIGLIEIGVQDDDLWARVDS